MPNARGDEGSAPRPQLGGSPGPRWSGAVVSLAWALVLTTAGCGLERVAPAGSSPAPAEATTTASGPSSSLPTPSAAALTGAQSESPITLARPEPTRAGAEGRAGGLSKGPDDARLGRQQILALPNGSACTTVADCDSGFCVDGFCCDVACGAGATNDCQACSVAAGAAANGTCGPIANGTLCSDNDMCTTGDVCTGGTCTPAGVVTCTPADSCDLPGTCNPATGVCTTPTQPDGTNCNDGNACTQQDTCVAGTCTGANPIVCPAASQCHDPGVCNPATGGCTMPFKADNSPCDDTNMCTLNEVCTSGVCGGGAQRSCDDNDACTNDSCIAVSGCMNIAIPVCFLDAGVDATDDAAEAGADLASDAPPDSSGPVLDTSPFDTIIDVPPVDGPRPEAGTPDAPPPSEVGAERAPDAAPTEPGPDAPIVFDGGTDHVRRVGGGGCDCSTGPGGGDASNAFTVPLLVGLGLLLARRRRRPR